MPRTADPDKVVALTERVVKLRRLVESPEWAELALFLEERKQFHIRRLTKQMMRGYPLTEEEQLRHAGFWKGVEAVLEAPEAVDAKLEKMLETSGNGAQKGAP